MRTAFDAIVVGAGPAGSTAAILLARAGWSVALVEKQRFPRRKVCGECVAASNLPLLEALGVGEAFVAAAGPPLRQVALMRGSRSVVADIPAAAHPRYPWGHALGRESLDGLLLERARVAGATVLQPWAVQAVEGAAGDHRCEIRPLDGGRAGAVLQAPVLIAANGSWEPLPSARALRRQARGAADLFAFKANFAGAELAPGLLPVLAFDGGYGGMVVADGGIVTVACCIRADRLEAWRRQHGASRAGDAVEALLRQRCAGVATALQDARRQGAWLASGPLDPGIRLRADDTLLRIGNAAGEAHPIIGEGMSMALQSAWLLCARLLADDSGTAAAAVTFDAEWQRAVRVAYAADWRRHFAPRLRLAAAFAHAAMRGVLAAPLVGLAQRWPAVLTQGARWAAKDRCAVDAATIRRLAAGADSTPANATLAWPRGAHLAPAPADALEPQDLA